MVRALANHLSQLFGRDGERFIIDMAFVKEAPVNNQAIDDPASRRGYVSAENNIGEERSGRYSLRCAFINLREVPGWTGRCH
jgi:hypothetical protein